MSSLRKRKTQCIFWAVLPFYKDTQIAGQVKIQGQVESKSDTEGKIYYEPDSGDDWDDEDPDDDLDF